MVGENVFIPLYSHCIFDYGLLSAILDDCCNAEGLVDEGTIKLTIKDGKIINAILQYVPEPEPCLQEYKINVDFEYEGETK